MKRTWPIIGVRDVASSCAWYQSLLGLPLEPPTHDYFGQIVDADGTVLLCLHAWGEHDHPSLTSSDVAGTGNASFSLSASTISMRAWNAHALFWEGWRASPMSTQTRAPWNCRYATPMATT